MYGVDIVGMACARCAIARTVCPDAGGKNLAIALHVVDGVSGTLDPIFGVHGRPIWMWALAYWECCLPREALDKAVRVATNKVLTVEGEIRWNAVTCPAGASVASLRRIGWHFIGGHILIADDGLTYNLQFDRYPPASSP